MAREDYEIIGSKPIGRGSFGTVFAARRVSDDRRVALKLVLLSGEWGAERIEAERKGAILQQRFAQSHGMVPELFEYGQDGDDFYIAMEYIDGASLEGVLRNGSLAPADAAEHARWLCCFLEKAHAFSGVVDGKSYRIVHTDLKPAHLMISASGERKVLDFGIAKALEESRELGTDIGRTIAYASPERLVSDQVNAHADFWSLGVMLYEMLCGHRPYPHLDGPRFRRELEHAITSNAPRAPLPPSCPGGLKAIVNKMLALQVEHRYPTAAAIKADVDAYLRGDVPAALVIYETPATTPVQRSASPRTQPVSAPVPLSPSPSVASAVPETIPRLPSREIPPTDIRMSTDAGSGVDTPVAVIAPPVAAVAVKRRSFVRRLTGVATMLAVVLVVATEGVAWLFAERFRDTMSTLDERTVSERRRAYEAVDDWALLDIGLKGRVHSRLRLALVSVGDRVIADYRLEEPAMGPAEWGQANEALSWAMQLSGRSASLRGKQLIAEGHVKRFEAQAATRSSQGALLSQAALAKFRDAANADPESLDPYLGMARILVYALSDVDGAAASIAEAQKRGYTWGRREAALLGDGYLRRAHAGRRRAGVLTGEQRERELTNARADYQRCVEFFDPIVAFGNAAQNLEICKGQIERIDRLLDKVQLEQQFERMLESIAKGS
ncbi:MAG: protein kinase [Acidobacteria bacterium]|nr:protein kinase [Acidobacteriota bacterium]